MKFNELSQELQQLWTRGVDHSVFNEDWAKMGGACRAQHDSTVFLYSQRGFIELVERRDLEPFFWDMPIHGDVKKQAEDGGVRMASPSECAEAGIDYVPFMGWRDIDSAPIDQTRVLLSTHDFGTLIGWRREYRIGWEKLNDFFSYEMIDTEGGDGGCNFEPFAAKKWMPLPLV